jgi:hypothetical protein
MPAQGMTGLAQHALTPVLPPLWPVAAQKNCALVSGLDHKKRSFSSFHVVQSVRG